MALVTIYLDGVPGRKERPQFARTASGVRTFSRPKTLRYEARLKDAGKAAWGWTPMSEPIKLTLTAVFPITQSWPKWRRVLAALGKLWHVGRPDIDNIVKVAFDGLNEVVWKDDAQVCWLIARKFYGETPGLWLEIETLDDTGGVAEHTGASDAAGDTQEG